MSLMHKGRPGAFRQATQRLMRSTEQALAESERSGQRTHQQSNPRTVREIDRRISEIKDGILACYEAIDEGRRKIERLEQERVALLQPQEDDHDD